MTRIDEVFREISRSRRLPIIFIGSGISKRYTSNTFNWKELLIKCISAYEKNPENKYKWYIEKICSEQDIDRDSHIMYKLLGSSIETDFNLNYYEGNIELEGVSDNDSPLKVYIKHLLENYNIKEEMKDEISSFQRLRDKMLTVITTNYDTFLEDYIFTNHEKMIKQQIFSGSELGTLIKIHGCVSEPSSMVLTMRDYERFGKKSKVLAAKVINLFAENPVFFFGYSITDENIRSFLRDVYSCLETEDEFFAFEKRLILVEYDEKRETPVVGNHTLDVDGLRINMTKIALSNYSYLYDEMAKLKSFVDLKEIQRLKSLVSDIVHDYDGEKKKVYNLIGDNGDFSGDEVVVVMGKISHVLNAVGLVGLKYDDIYEDVLFGSLKGKYSVQAMVELALPNILKGNTILPVHGYLNKVDLEKLVIDEKVMQMAEKEPIDLATNSISRDLDSFLENSFDSLESIYLSDLPTSKKLHYLFFQSIYVASTKELRSFLREYYHQLMQINATLTRKLICILDIRENKNTHKENKTTCKV